VGFLGVAEPAVRQGQNPGDQHYDRNRPHLILHAAHGGMDGGGVADVAADELDVAYERIEMVSADTARTPDEGMTAGSLSVENSGTALRFACAEARGMLLDMSWVTILCYSTASRGGDELVDAGTG